MYTSNFGGEKYNKDLPGQPLREEQEKPKTVYSSEIQICPVYLEKFKQQKIKTFADSGPLPAAARPRSTWQKIKDELRNKEEKPPIDTLKTSDVILMHEMTHAIWGGGTDDVGAAYGWLNIRGISDKESGNNVEKATNNADNLAYFCLGAKMISPGGSKTPQRAVEDGYVEAMAMVKVKRKARNALRRLRREEPEPTSSKPSSSSSKVPTSKPETTSSPRAPPPPGAPPAKPPSTHSISPEPKEVLYTTVNKVLTTIVTKEIKKPWKTIVDAHHKTDGSKSSQSKPSHLSPESSKAAHHKPEHGQLTGSRTGSSTGSHAKAARPTTSSAGADREVLYKTVKEVYTTTLTKKVKEPWTTIEDAHQHAPPKPGDSTASHSKASRSTRSHGEVSHSSSSHSKEGRNTVSTGSHSKATHSSASQTSHPRPGHGGPVHDTTRSKPTSSSGSHSTLPGPTTSSAAAAAAAQYTTITATSGSSTSTVVFVGALLPVPKGKGGPAKPAWRCTGPICDPKCLFPVLCKSTGGNSGSTWGFKAGWDPLPHPGGPPPPPGGPSPPPKDNSKPPPDDGGDSNNSKPNHSEPKHSEPTKSEATKSEPTTSREDKTSTHSTTSASSSSCRPRITSICPVIATVIDGSDGKKTTNHATGACKTTTLHDCSTTLRGSTSTTTVLEQGPVITPLVFVDNFNMGVANYESLRDAVLAALVADTTDAYAYVDGLSTSSARSTGSHKTSSKPKETHNTSSKQKETHKSSSKSKETHKPTKSTKPSAGTSTKHTSSATKPTPTKDTPSFKAESCGKDKTKVREHADFVQSGSEAGSLYNPFCQGLDANKPRNSTVISTFGVVSFGYIPSQTIKKQSWEYKCTDAFDSLSMGCSGMYWPPFSALPPGN